MPLDLDFPVNRKVMKDFILEVLEESNLIENLTEAITDSKTDSVDVNLSHAMAPLCEILGQELSSNHRVLKFYMDDISKTLEKINDNLTKIANKK